MDIKTCSKCKMEKPIINYWKDSNQKDGHCHQCIPCKKQTQSKVYSDPDKKKHHMASVRKWNDGNKVKNKIYQKSHNTKKRSTPLGKLKSNMSTYLNICIRSQRNTNFKQRTLGVIGLKSWDEFLIHIESQWLEGMSWDNWGVGKNNTTWHIDHKIPVSQAQTEDEVYKLFHYTNLQPMWGSDNIRKRNNI